MATTFSVVIAQANPTYARQACEALFAELDLLESRLSRFTEQSDIYRIDHLRSGQSTVIHPDTWNCLRIALAMQAATQGAFDIAYASDPIPHNVVAADVNPLIIPFGSSPESIDITNPEPHAKVSPADAGVLRCPNSAEKVSGLTSAATLVQGRAMRIALEPRNRVRVLAEGVRLDLGGIGKGYALDRMAVLLHEWDLDQALLSASTSTILALEPPLDAPGWPIQFGPETEPCHLTLHQNAFSGSGRAVQGSHIMNPHTGQPAESRFRAWAGAPTGAEADALSTAFMIMAEQDIAHLCKHQPQFSAFIQKSPNESVVRIF